MWLTSLKTHHFRNGIPGIDGSFSLFNGIFGPNSRGKTNFLEAIYYIAHLKSWRTSHKRDLIHWSGDEASIKAVFESEHRTHEVLIRLFPDRREVVVDGKSIRSWASYKCPFVAVLFAPEDAYLWRESPESRRSYLDQMLFHEDTSYWALERAYRRVLDEKNTLLKDGRLSTLSVWNEQLVDYGSEILVRRFDYLRKILPLYQSFYSRIVRNQGVRENLSIFYRFHREEIAVDGEKTKEAWRERFVQALQDVEDVERRQRVAVVGPHRDDWGLHLEGHAVSVTASQGEHRSLVMALKLAEVTLLRDEFGEPPIFLVDDLGSELDANRRRFLIETLLETRCQTFLTSTDSGPFVDLLPPGESRIVEI